MNKRRFVCDIFLNILAQGLPIMLIQLIILPYISKVISDGNEYGKIIMAIGFVSIFNGVFSISLNNIRLLYDKEYKIKNYEGDFNILLLISVVISSVLSFIIIPLYCGINGLFDVILVVVAIIVNVVNTYQAVAFRINLDYGNILVNSFVSIVGYTVGFVGFYFTGYWQLIYILGYGASFIFIHNKSGLLKEKLTLTPLFKKTARESSLLALSGIVSSVNGYFDRLFLLPFFGGISVSIYYSAILISKMFGLVTTPLSSVFLSYLIRIDNFSKKKFLLVVAGAFACGVAAFWFSIFVSPIALSILYPEYSKEALKIIKITSATASVGIICSLINPFLLKFKVIAVQIGISFSILIIRIVLSISLSIFFGTYGFCFGELISVIVQLLMLVSIFMFAKKPE